MPSYTTADIRNLAILGSAGAGKTTLVETLLHTTGAIGRAGRVEDGNTVCDYDDLEKDVNHSLDSAVVHVDHGGAHINLIDTPGGGDFLGKALSTLPAVETVVVCIDAANGIDPVVRRVMKRAEERNLPRLIVVNKIDNAPDIGGILTEIQEAFGTVCQPINLPNGGGSAVVDCFGTAEGDSDLGDVADYHTGIVDQVVEVDEALMEQYLEQGEVNPGQLHDPFTKALREGHLVPVCFTAARENVGITELLDIMAKHCPSPAEGNPRTFEYGKGDGLTEWTAEPDPSKPVVAHVFKVSSDPFVGKLCVFRVHQGHIAEPEHPSHRG